MSTIIVLAGGDSPRPLPDLPSPDAVIAADSGLALAAPLGLIPDLVIGDMDSVPLELLADAEAAGATVERYPQDKDATDLELALDAARVEGATSIIVVGGGGGRLDHLLANAALIGATRYPPIEWYVDDYRISVVTRTHDIVGTAGDLVTLLALGGPATVTAQGLRWALEDEGLMPGSTRGVSNELVDETATVRVAAGRIAVMHRRTR